MAKESFREQVMMDELNINARLQFSLAAGERQGFSRRSNMNEEMEA